MVGLTTPGAHARAIERTAARHLDFIERAAKRAGVRCKCLLSAGCGPLVSVMVH